MARPSVMAHSFSQVPTVNVPRSMFNRSSGHKTTMEFDELVPIFCEEVLPGDTMNLRVDAFGRLTTLLEPILDNMYLDTFFFFVPNRLVWDNWTKFMGEQEDPSDTTDYVLPVNTTPMGGYAPETLYDYFGIPVDVDNLDPQALPIRAYNLIFNEWFRDQNLIDAVPVDKGDGPDTDTNYSIQKRGKRHDYFTSCLPWPQKEGRGDPVTLPLGTSAPVISDGSGQPLFDVGGATNKALYADGTTTNVHFSGAAPGSSGNATWASPRLAADLTNATAATINQLREAFQIQRMQERDARGGSRYVELVKSHFGVSMPHAYWRSEYLGGGSSPIHVQQVESTTASVSDIGDLGAFGTLGISGDGFTKSFTEHGHVIGIACARADLNYQQGLDRMWSRSTRYDFYWPSLAHLGEQAVLSKEIYADGTSSDEDVFGYQERFAEYRYRRSQITGLLRSNVTGSLDLWHLAQDFATRPTLGKAFIEQDTPITRILQVTAAPPLKVDMYFHLNHARPMPIYAEPGMLDRF